MSSFTSLLAQTCTHQRQGALSEDPITGAAVRAGWQDVATGIPVRLSWGAGGEAVRPESDQRGQVRSARLFFDPDYGPVEHGDRFIFAEHPGLAFEVTFHKLVFASEAPHHWEVDAEVITGA